MHRTVRPAILALLAVLVTPGKTLAGSSYDAGPGWSYPTLVSLPWKSLQPGDIVNIHTKPGGYHESFLISASGTTNQPIIIHGVPDPTTGALPIIDGDNAVQDPTMNIWATVLTQYGVVLISRTLSQPYGYIPANIVIENLDIRHAKKDYTYTNYAGVSANWAQFCASIYTEMAQNLTIHNCELHDSGLGFYVNSKYGNAALSSNVVVDGCWIHDNGNAGSYSEHNIYMETAATTIQHCLIGPAAAGSFAEDIKDRSAGTIIRYNTILMGGDRGGQGIWLLQPQGGLGVIDQMPTYTNSWIYGNVIYDAPGGAGPVMIRYDAGSEDIAHAHKGTLFVYHNTLINQADKYNSGSVTGRYKAAVLMLPATSEFGGGPVPEIIDFRNNIIVNKPQTPGAAVTDLALLQSDGGTVNLGTNWFSSTIFPIALPYGVSNFTGQITGLYNSMIGTVPGFVDFNNQDFHLAATSACINAGGPLAPSVVGRYDTTEQYLNPHSFESRSLVGPAMDLGAFEFPGTGLPYAQWKAVHFGANSNNTAIAGDTADPDGDGIANLLEYALQMNPNLPDGGLLPASTTTNGHLSIIYRRDPNTTDITYEPEVSSDLLHWTNGPAFIATSVVSSNATTIFMLAQDNVPTVNAPQRFIRLRITRP